ncbi:MAG: cation transporter [Ignavibacteriales bacterium]|jgi:Co/Zn/Cd efflux system component|nr:cation transporter [Ignavibacteriaceae bacterium]NLH61724.1 cation transporter [Ignavibacteriales bacterium]HOJ19326.1 cation transporter [Ignavibacteriaceae bacterium]HPO55403.1 cation transporter [Ignavibacteriaceae bacterium]
MKESSFQIPQMDCPSEENLIRLTLQDEAQIASLDFDIPNRILTVFHTGDSQTISHKLERLSLGSKLIYSRESTPTLQKEHSAQRNILWTVLLINFAFFLIEVLTGWISGSMGLIADSLDMLADALVYGLSLIAVSAGLLFKKRVATLAGYLQITLAFLGFVEVIRRFLSPGDIPDFWMMIIISSLALLANSLSLFLLQKSKSKELHIQASMIFTSNDVIINAGVILAGIQVKLLNSGIPDLLIGTIVFILVIRGAFRILKLSPSP